MDWKFIDTQADLDFFKQSICWNDFELIELHGSRLHSNYFPHDVSYSGHSHLNLHALYESYRYLHLVMISCEHFSDNWISGRVDALKRIEFYNWENKMVMRCARMIYRFLPENEVLSNQPYLCRFLAPPEY